MEPRASHIQNLHYTGNSHPQQEIFSQAVHKNVNWHKYLEHSLTKLTKVISKVCPTLFVVSKDQATVSCYNAYSLPIRKYSPNLEKCKLVVYFREYHLKNNE